MGFLLLFLFLQNTDAVHLALKLNNSELMGRKLRVMRSVNKEKLKQSTSNPSLKNASKPKQKVTFSSKNAGCSKNAFIGEKAVLTKKKKGQKKKVKAKKPKNQQ